MKLVIVSSLLLSFILGSCGYQIDPDYTEPVEKSLEDLAGGTEDLIDKIISDAGEAAIDRIEELTSVNSSSNSTRNSEVDF